MSVGAFFGSASPAWAANAPLEIPLDTSDGYPFFSIRTTLDGASYTLQFFWAAREGRWYLTILDLTGAPLIAGLKLLANWPLLRKCQYLLGIPKGNLMAADYSPQGGEPPGLTEARDTGPAALLPRIGDVVSVELLQRAYRLVVGELEIKSTPGQPSLNIRFSIKKSLKPEPNKAEIKIWNLNDAHRSALAQMKVVPVSLEAGYEGSGGTSMIFLGNLRAASTQREGPDLITTVSSGDKEQLLRTARTNRSFKKGAGDLTTIFRLLAQDLGVTEGNIAQASAAIAASPLKSIVSRGFVLSGAASREMTDLCRSVGYSWSVQDGALQLVPIAKALSGTALAIGPTTGMVGSPTVDNKGFLNVKVLMMPDVFPGRLMVLTSEYLKGNYRIEETTHTGEMQGQDWYVDIKGKSY